jgi:hypothetical protein
VDTANFGRDRDVRMGLFMYPEAPEAGWKKEAIKDAK